MTGLNKKDLFSEPRFEQGSVVSVKGYSGFYKVPEDKDVPEQADWKPRDCLDCRMIKNDQREPCCEYVLMELDPLKIPNGKIITHICERLIKLAK